ncbi:hypothetical protein IWQ61_007128 [Dispira simplex]|nr:hypothetical protein IWQ61_007128 [Dispira simplex]
MFPAALDETIVATSMTLMASSFNALALAPWIATAYWMTITAFSPIFGKLADVFGLRRYILICTSIFLLGSVLCAVAFDIIWLIVFRAISGIAAAGMLTVVLVAISKLTPPEKRTTTTVASSTTKERLLALDYLGTGLVLAGIIALVLGIEWGGTEFAWQTPRVIVLLVVGVTILLIFGWVELKVVADPIVDLRIMKVRNVSISCLTNFALGWVTNGTIYNIPLYIQFLDGVGATKAGLYLLPFLLSLNVMGVASAYFIERFVGIMVIGGAGVGFASQSSFLPAHFQILKHDLAQATALINFYRIIGSVFGMSITGSVAKSIFLAETDANHYPVSLHYLLESLEHIYQLDESLRQEFVLTYVYAIGWDLFSMIGISVPAFCAALGYKRCNPQ